jgi:hypothetical protein
MKTYTPEEMKMILENHKAWLEGCGGSRANLSGANLSRANLSRANLSGADLSGADLSGADLSGAYLSRANLSRANLSRANLSRANLSGAYLYGADLSRADLSGANLYGAYLSRANLSGANLSRANLSGADLSGANLSGADLSGADLSGAYLYGADLEKAVIFTGASPPEEGNFVAFKKVVGAVLKLEIIGPRTGSYLGRKCRAQSARVIEVVSGNAEVKEWASMHDSAFKYRLGETVEVKDWDGDPRNECTRGIHFFMTKKEAEEYN